MFRVLLGPYVPLAQVTMLLRRWSPVFLIRSSFMYSDFSLAGSAVQVAFNISNCSSLIVVFNLTISKQGSFLAIAHFTLTFQGHCKTCPWLCCLSSSFPCLATVIWFYPVRGTWISGATSWGGSSPYFRRWWWRFPVGCILFDCRSARALPHAILALNCRSSPPWPPV